MANPFSKTFLNNEKSFFCVGQISFLLVWLVYIFSDCPFVLEYILLYLSECMCLSIMFIPEGYKYLPGTGIDLISKDNCSVTSLINLSYISLTMKRFTTVINVLYLFSSKYLPVSRTGLKQIFTSFALFYLLSGELRFRIFFFHWYSQGTKWRIYINI